MKTQTVSEKLKSLKQGDTFYDVGFLHITEYEYLMPYPFRNPKNVKIEGYHIILNKSKDEPQRIYYTFLERILSKGATTFQEAQKIQVEVVEIYLNDLKEQLPI